MLATFGRKLGIEDAKVTNKGQEILRLIDVKNINLLNGVSKFVVALDLAATTLKFPFDRKHAISLSGISKQNYTAALQLLEDVLNLSRHVTIKDICVQLGCANVTQEAEFILSKYREIYDSYNAFDCEKPMFLAAAVCVACKKLKTKINQAKLIELAKAKPVVLRRIITAMEPLAKREDDSKKSAKRPRTLLEAVEEKLAEATNKKMKDDDSEETQTCDYASWRERILANAEMMTNGE